MKFPNVAALTAHFTAARKSKHRRKWPTENPAGTKLIKRFNRDKAGAYMGEVPLTDEDRYGHPPFHVLRR